jgi:hypothetical protein
MFFPLHKNAAPGERGRQEVESYSARDSLLIQYIRSLLPHDRRYLTQYQSACRKGDSNSHRRRDGGHIICQNLRENKKNLRNTDNKDLENFKISLILSPL